MTPETVTPTKFRAADGTVYERTGEKRTPEVGELHWCDATRPAPYPFEWPPTTYWEPREDWPPSFFQCDDPKGTMQVGEPPAARTVSNYLHPNARPCKNCGLPYAPHIPPNTAPCRQIHKCAIWKISEEQDWQPPTPVASQDNPIDSLIDKLKTTAGDLESIPVLAMLYQAKALERIADTLAGFCETWVAPYSSPRPATNADLIKVGAYVCGFCAAGEHSDCANPTECICVECHAPPPCPVEGGPHRFEGMEDNHFCTQCGGGRLHLIHQTA